MKACTLLLAIAAVGLVGCPPDYLDLGADYQGITTGSSSTTTTTTDPFCTPGETRPCYTGPEGTDGVGECHGGTQTCNPDGNAFGACEDEQPPQQEDCMTLDKDEDCDGLNTCEEKLWSRRLGDTADQFGRALAVNAAGEIAIGGSFAGAIDFGEFFLSSPAGQDGFIAKLDAAGHAIWSRQISGAGDEAASAIAVDDMGNVVAAGVFEGTIDVAGKALTAAGFDSFVAKFGPQGDLLWATAVSGPQSENIASVAIDTQGNILLGGFFNGTAEVGDYQLPSAGNLDSFVAKLDAAGSVLWAKAFGGPGEQRATGVAFDAMGDALITGFFIGNINLGDGPSPFASSFNVFLAKLDPDGATAWARTFVGSANQKATALSVDPAGTAVISGELSGTMDLGGAVLEAAPGAIDTFVASFDGAGLHSWSHRFNQTQLRSLGRGAEGRTYLSGSFVDPIDFGAGAMPSEGSSDIFLAMFDSGGVLLSQYRWGDPDTQESFAVCGTSSGKAILTGSFSGALDFGSGLLTSAGGRDLFVARVAP